MDVGIIGAGRMGLLLGRVIESRGYNVAYYDQNRDATKRAESLGYRIYDSVSELVRNSEYIVVAVSSRSIVGVLESIRELLSEVDSKRIVFDISTFKEDIISVYQRFPENAIVSSIHPMFGPGAKSTSLYWVIVVPIPGREEEARIVVEFVENLGFRVEVVNWELHDEMVARSIGTSYIIGLIISNIAVESIEKYGVEFFEKLEGTTFKILRYHMESILLDLEDLAIEILSRKRVKRIIGELVGILRSLGVDSIVVERAQKYVELVGRDRLAESYRKIYCCLELCTLLGSA